MYPAHYALGMAFHSRQKDDSLSVMAYFLIGSQFTDLLWTGLTVIGIEGGHSMGSMLHHHPILPWSHSLAMHGVWAVMWGVLGLILFRGNESAKRIAALGVANVFVHYALDLAVEDMPLLPVGDILVPGPGLYDMPMWWPFLGEMGAIAILWLIYDQTMKSQARLSARSGSFAALGAMMGLHVIVFGPTFQNAPAVDLGAEPTAVLGYTFFLVLGIVMLMASHWWATRRA